MLTQVGTIEVVFGCMFSGKTKRLIKLGREIPSEYLQIFKPIIDDRYATEAIVSHDGDSLPARRIRCGNEILEFLLPKTRAIVVDEGQFLDWQLESAAQRLVALGVRVIIGGLDTDFTGEPFGIMPQIIAIADKAKQLYGRCAVCGGQATRTQRLVNGQPARRSDQQILVGGSNAYECRCRAHHVVA